MLTQRRSQHAVVIKKRVILALFAATSDLEITH